MIAGRLEADAGRSSHHLQTRVQHLRRLEKDVFSCEIALGTIPHPPVLDVASLSLVADVGSDGLVALRSFQPIVSQLGFQTERWMPTLLDVVVLMFVAARCSIFDNLSASLE